MRIFPMTVLAATLVAAACSDATGGGDGAPAPGTFQATISGDYAASAQGTARNTGLELATASTGFLDLRDERDSANATLLEIRFNHPPAAVGTYTLTTVPGDLSSGVNAAFWRYDMRADDETDMFVPRVGGTLVIESVSGNTVRGNVNLQKVGVDGPTTYNFHYTGRFTATP